MPKKLKTIPDFKSREEETKFWDNIDAFDYFGFKRMHPKEDGADRTTTISFRVSPTFKSNLESFSEEMDIPLSNLMRLGASLVMKELTASK